MTTAVYRGRILSALGSVRITKAANPRHLLLSERLAIANALEPFVEAETAQAYADGANSENASLFFILEEEGEQALIDWVRDRWEGRR